MQFFVDVDLSEADPFGLTVGRFYERHPTGMFLANGSVSADNYYESSRWDNSQIVGKHQAAKVVASWTHGAHIIGAVPNFDTETLDTLLRRHQHLPGARTTSAARGGQAHRTRRCPLGARPLRRGDGQINRRLHPFASNRLS
jgi:hypothetical protein